MYPGSLICSRKILVARRKKAAQQRLQRKGMDREKGKEGRESSSRRNPHAADLHSAYQVGEILEALSSYRLLSPFAYFRQQSSTFAPPPTTSLRPLFVCSLFLFFLPPSSVRTHPDCVRAERKLAVSFLFPREYPWLDWQPPGLKLPLAFSRCLRSPPRPPRAICFTLFWRYVPLFDL